jgi:hypothetical protein
MRDARALDPDERVARGRIDHVATASCHHRAHRAAPIASSRAHPARHPRRNTATQPERTGGWIRPKLFARSSIEPI